MSTPITEQEYRKLKQDVEDAKNEASRARGALDTVLARLKEEFECEDLEAAKKKLVQLRKEATEAEESFQELAAAYQEKWHD